MLNLGKRLVTLSHRLAGLRNYIPGTYLGPGRNVRLFNGKLRPPFSCSVVAVEHCNLTCRDCNHASPVVPADFAKPAKILPGLKNLAEVYRPRAINLIGGEPLLHPDLSGLISAVKSAGLGKYVSVTTNAQLLGRMPDSFWQEVNSLELSLYPGFELDATERSRLIAKAQHHHIRLIAYKFDRFRVTFSLRGTRDPELAERIFRTCEMAHLWGCHTIAEGHFFKCAQSIYVPQIPGCAASHPETTDGISLAAGEGLFDRLYRYLSSDKPLRACGFCLGTVGKTRPHRLVDPKSWPNEFDAPAEELIDFDRLDQLERNQPKRFKEHREALFKVNA